MAGSSSDEYQVVLKRIASIPKLSQHSVSPLANELLAKELINVAQHEIAMNVNQPALNRATDLLTIVQERIENEASVFYQYVSVLKNCGLGNVAKDLESDMAKRKSQGSGEYRLHVDIIFV